MKFAKGHGTENDFVIIEDHEGTLELSPERVRVLCDRRAGIGGDGLLRVVRAGALGEPLAEGIAPADWFMDYRNADGSVAEMCGNGTRVFAHWVRSRGLVDSESFVVGTRAGAKQVTVHSFDEHDAQVSVEMGPAEVTGVSTASMVGENFAGLGVDMGNPHLAAVIPGLTPESLEDMAFAQPEFDHEFFPHGVNVEVLTQLVDGAVSMRVFERGVGETRSCGTGTVAAARAALADAGEGAGTVTVNVPGGQVQVEIFDGGSRLTGPSRIVAEGTTVL
ncbi:MULTISPECIES: diaminopimelate epimerase [Corynebacterium]|uniref:diaminopimelate epimerase n=1 Tax=Corynebacterium TaxID=1716 RepID=UPI0008A3A554|nr:MULTISPECIES: diaminopimelate epimerase [Corynebacterium]EGT5574276.1 diaminopimelate epimerase [Corynebacterium striatum]EGT5786559.1 diaminopimelate epimerase [Corynebacterium striatum]MDK8808179.1 diaminopimelate epimerase [Corynebacterium striatum]MDK8880569.1 diaminopimelate epimerase [Corynebacterium striatum]OFT61806.1 diaminopimelate epimerase [Corynebacterium sp. HMSC05D08]